MPLEALGAEPLDTLVTFNALAKIFESIESSRESINKYQQVSTTLAKSGRTLRTFD